MVNPPPRRTCSLRCFVSNALGDSMRYIIVHAVKHRGNDKSNYSEPSVKRSVSMRTVDAAFRGITVICGNLETNRE